MNGIINKLNKHIDNKSHILKGYYVSRMDCLLGLGGGKKC